MQRSVYLQGELGEKFGNKFIVSTNNYADIFKCINANRPEFLPYVRNCAQDDIGFIVETADGTIDEEDLLTPLSKGDVTISLVPAGSKSGIGKILAAIAIVIIIVSNPAIFGAVAEGAAAGATAGNFALGLNTFGQIAASMALNLALTGIQQLMAPDPAVDQDAPTNYLFSGGANNAVEGDPIPLLYGELRVPGRPIAVDILQGGNGSPTGGLTQETINNTIPDSANNTNIVSQKQEA